MSLGPLTPACGPLHALGGLAIPATCLPPSPSFLPLIRGFSSRTSFFLCSPPVTVTTHVHNTQHPGRSSLTCCTEMPSSPCPFSDACPQPYRDPSSLGMQLSVNFHPLLPAHPAVLPDHSLRYALLTETSTHGLTTSWLHFLPCWPRPVHDPSLFSPMRIRCLPACASCHLPPHAHTQATGQRHQTGWTSFTLNSNCHSAMAHKPGFLWEGGRPPPDNVTPSSPPQTSHSPSSTLALST